MVFPDDSDQANALAYHALTNRGLLTRELDRITGWKPVPLKNRGGKGVMNSLASLQDLISDRADKASRRFRIRSCGLLLPGRRRSRVRDIFRRGADAAIESPDGLRGAGY